MKLMLPSEALNQPFVGAGKAVSPADDRSEITNKSVSYHAFRISDIGMLIPQQTISEVTNELDYCHLPNTNSVLYGMGNLRGNIIPIFDLHELFGISIGDNDNRNILILGRGDDAVALMISELPKRISISQDNRLQNMPPIPETLRTYTKGCYQEDGIWLDIDHGFYSSLSEHVQ